MNPRHQDEGRGWVFHPYELAFVGYSNSGKTTLLSKLVPLLDLEIAFVKRDAHKFSMDTPGKDTHTLTGAGAKAVFISDPVSQALLRQEPLDPVLSRLDFLAYDAVLVEGHKQSAIPKIVVLDEKHEILGDPAFKTKAPLAVVGPSLQAPPLPWKVPYFHRDAGEDIAAFIKSYWNTLAQSIPLYGLVLTGGKSSRMGQDKAAMEYRGEAETEAARTFRQLQEVCDDVFVSCRADQADWPGRAGFPQIHDTHLNLGPLSGILSAFDFRPDAAWLVVACDLPRLEERELLELKKARHPFRFATAFKGFQDFPEPLCAIYEPKSKQRLLQFLAAGYDCPRKMLINSPIHLLSAERADALENVNNPEEREKVIHDFRR